MIGADQVIRVISSNALGNVILLVAAVVGVLGNFLLYARKRHHRRGILRNSLHAEIRSMRPVVQSMHLQHDAISMDPIDPRSFLVDSVYRASSDELGLLMESEVSAVVEFYSTAISIQRVIGDDFHTAYDQVARRDLLQKLERATTELAENGSIDSESRQEVDEHLEMHQRSVTEM